MSSPATQEEIFSKVTKVINDMLQVRGESSEEMTMDSDVINELGIDSVEVLDLLGALETEFDVKLNAEEAPSKRTVGDIVGYVQSQLGESLMAVKAEEVLDLIGKWKYPEKKFVTEKLVTIKATNVFGNTYFSNFVEWQGETREKFFLSHPAAGVFLQGNPQLMLITHTLQHRFHSHAFFGDMLRIELTSKNIMDYSVMIMIRYFRAADNELIGEGWQKICFWDNQANQAAKVPQLFLDLALSVQE